MGGWVGRPGHAMLYKITRRSNRNFDIYIINPSNCKYHESVFHDHKTLVAPIEVIEDIPPYLLCVGESIETSFPDFFLRLVNYRILEDQVVFRSDQDIYEKAFGFLASQRRTIATTDVRDFRTPQRGGTCSSTVLKVLGAHELGDHFELFKSKLDFETILVFANSRREVWSNADPELVDELRYQEKLIEADELRYLLRSAITDHFLSLSKRALLPGVCKRETENRFRVLTRLLDDIDTVEAKVRIKRLTTPNRVLWKIPTQTPDCRAILEGALAFRSAIDQKMKRSLKSSEAFFPMTPLPKDFLDFLKNALEHLAAIGETETTHSPTYRIAIEKYGESLPPMQTEFWGQIPDIQLKESSRILFQLLKNYSTTFATPSLHPHEHNTALYLFCALHKILSRLDATEKNFLEGYGVYVDCFRAQMDDRFFIFFHPQELKKRLELLEYLEGVPSTEGLLCKFSPTYFRLTTTKEYRALPDYRLLKKIQGSREEALQKKITNAVRTLHTKNSCSISEEITEAAYLLTEGLNVFDVADSKAAVQLMKAATWLQLFGGYSWPCPKEEVPTRLLTPLHEYYPEKKIWIVGHTYPSRKEYLSYFHPGKMVGFSGLHRIEYSAFTAKKGEDKGDTLEGVAQQEPLVRKVSDLPSEGKVMVLFTWKAAAKIPFEKLLARTQSAPSFQTALLFFFLEENVSRLYQSDAMTLIELMLYKPLLRSDNTWVIPLFEEIFTSPSLVIQLETFIMQSLSFLCDKQSASSFNVYPCLFL